MLEVKGISKSYYKKEVLKRLSFNVNMGEVFGVLGVNGAGKTTALNIVTGYLLPDCGDVLIDGINIKNNPYEYKSRIGYLPEIPPLYDYMTVYGYLDFVCRIKGVKKGDIDSTIKSVLYDVKADDVLNRLIGNLSKGYKQRIGLAQAFIGNPDVIILDEPTTGLDPVQISEMNNVINKLRRNAAVILSSHVLAEVSMVCDRVLIIDGGNAIAEGKPAELTQKFGGQEFITFRINGNIKDVSSLFSKSDVHYSVLSSDNEFCSIEFETTGINNAEFFIGKLLYEGGLENFSVIEKRHPTLNDVFLNVVRRND